MKSKATSVFKWLHQTVTFSLNPLHSSQGFLSFGYSTLNSPIVQVFTKPSKWNKAHFYPGVPSKNGYISSKWSHAQRAKLPPRLCAWWSNRFAVSPPNKDWIRTHWQLLEYLSGCVFTHPQEKERRRNMFNQICFFACWTFNRLSWFRVSSQQ